MQNKPALETRKMLNNLGFGVTPVVLCGGSGSRLWPVSTPARPKQFQPIISTSTMLIETLERARTIGARRAPILVGSAKHSRELATVAEHYQGVAVLEPEGRNTAPAIAM